MIYKIELFNVEISIYARNTSEQEVVDTWWFWFNSNCEMRRVSVILSFVEYYKLYYEYKWTYCSRLSLVDNIRAFFGFRKQIRVIRKAH